MLRKIIFLIASLLPVVLMAQNTVSINCTFDSATANDSCTLIPSRVFIDEYEKQFKAPIIKSQCSFSFTTDEPTIAQCKFRNQSFSVFIEPGDVMQWKISGDTVISFSEKGAEANRFLQSFLKTFSHDFDNDAAGKEILNSDADAFEMNLYDERKKQLAFYNSDPQKNSFSEAFKKYMENTIRYNYFARLLSFPIVTANQSPQILTVKAYPPLMLQGIDSTLVNDNALNCECYRDFLFYYAAYFASKSNGFNKFKDLSLATENKIKIAYQQFSEASLNWFIAWMLNNNLEKMSQYSVKHIYSMLSLSDNKCIYTKLLQKKVDARLAEKDVALAETKTAQPASTSSKSIYPKLKDIDGNYFTLDDLKGKVVYVDFWASWCGPCRNQMPYSKQLQEMFSDKQKKQLVFLYISIDQSEDDWKSAVKQIGMEGKLAISPGNWNSEITKFFQINSIPRYMLIDKKGNIVDLDAKRPSSGTDIYNDIVKLLE